MNKWESQQRKRSYPESDEHSGNEKCRIWKSPLAEPNRKVKVTEKRVLTAEDESIAII